MSNVPRASAESLFPLCSIPLKDRRRRDRLNLLLGAHVRPFHSGQKHLEEVTTTLDFSRNGLSFLASSHDYYFGMVLVITVPYCSEAPVVKEYQAQVVRIESRSDGSQLVAVKFLS